MAADLIKANGVHYTPPALAAFLASLTVRSLGRRRGQIRVLDPACGSGALLCAFAQAVPQSLRPRLALVGYETDEWALRATQRLLADRGVASVTLKSKDFLAAQGLDPPLEDAQLPLFSTQCDNAASVDVIIANPPYVRTQVLGAQKSQELSRRFGLSGRIDLYQAFTKAMAGLLRPGGTLGLLTSNRFLTIKSGVALRRLLRKEFHLEAIYDLGDTKLFSAAVLPVVVVAKKCRNEAPTPTVYDRVYEARATEVDRQHAVPCTTLLEAFENRSIEGHVAIGREVFKIERGVLSASSDDEAWSLSTPEYTKWLEAVAARQTHCFDDIGRIRVGIKTTADEVFIREDWETLDAASRPEPRLLRPLITHHDASRWRWSESTKKRVLYPHEQVDGRRKAVVLERFPGALRYLGAHKRRLAGRKYVTESGRAWYEIWVPHNPRDWAKPKVVFPDIAEQPRFFLDSTGAIVNGDCYWITLRDGFAPDWLLLLLAVANSSFATRYYDVAFHNKLYAGRRRFMTQYVKKFPLPDLRSATGRRIVHLVRQVVENHRAPSEMEEEANRLVWESFGLVEKAPG